MFNLMEVYIILLPYRHASEMVGTRAYDPKNNNSTLFRQDSNKQPSVVFSWGFLLLIMFV